MKPVLIDTSTIVALLDRSEHRHQACVDALAEISRPLVTCEAVIAETCHLLRRMPGATEAVLQNIQSGVIRIPWGLAGRELQVSELIRQYAKVPMAFADACLVCMAEEFATGDILTLDSDFEVYRWSTRKTFKILVEPRQRSKK
ncbi:MAG: PIN domain-containing protein [Deltaproteobacteria bacterium]|nr:PIN domain-containing protein [Deltaproteobacteria bacterium]